jgi:hypothetical protein
MERRVRAFNDELASGWTLVATPRGAKPVTSLRGALDAALARLALVGADPADDEDMRPRKALLVLVAVLILPIALLWGGLYLALGAPSGSVAFLYFGVSLASIAVFARTRNFPFLLRTQLLASLLAPTVSMVPTGDDAKPRWGCVASASPRTILKTWEGGSILPTRLREQA